jgi:hypothetical protein
MTNDEFFALADHTIWRLETLPQYNPRSDDAYQVWAERGVLLPLDQRSGKQQWMAAVAKATAAGKRVGRVRLHHGPDAYGAYSLAVYGENATAGEDVRILDLRHHPELAWLVGDDFWLMDEQLAVLMRYHPDGEYLDRTTTRDPDILAACVGRRDLVLAHAVSLADYLALERRAG